MSSAVCKRTEWNLFLRGLEGEKKILKINLFFGGGRGLGRHILEQERLKNWGDQIFVFIFGGGGV